MTQVNVETDRFSGPLGLLLHLIRQEEMDIFDININQITKQYLESIKQIKKLNLEGAGEFIAMAATLIQIKSKMLLPQYNEQGEIVETEDPRKDLVRRLLEYQMYQDAGQKLYRLPLLNRDVWSRGEVEKIETPDSEIELEEGNALYSLIAAYRHAVKNMKRAVHKVAQALQSISDRIWDMREKLVVGRQTRLSELVAVNPHGNNDQRGHILITFLSLLEMAKIGLVSLFQSENYADIHVDTLKQVDRDMISNVENYEAAENMGGVTEITVDAVDLAEADAAEASDDYANQQMLLTVENVPVEGDTLPQDEAATDDEILAEEMKMLADETGDLMADELVAEIAQEAAENDNWTEFVNTSAVSTDAHTGEVENGEEKPKEIEG
jgi:segregation and condensation protein A